MAPPPRHPPDMRPVPRQKVSPFREREERLREGRDAAQTLRAAYPHASLVNIQLRFLPPPRPCTPRSRLCCTRPRAPTSPTRALTGTATGSMISPSRLPRPSPRRAGRSTARLSAPAYAHATGSAPALRPARQLHHLAQHDCSPDATPSGAPTQARLRRGPARMAVRHRETPGAPCAASAGSASRAGR